MLTLMHYSNPFERLKKSRFRRSFRLDSRELSYVREKGIGKISEYARQILEKRLRKKPENDGRQTPYKGALFKAMHATATCCRKCMFKWHRVPLYRDMTGKELDYAVWLITEWVRRQLSEARHGSPDFKHSQEQCLAESRKKEKQYKQLLPSCPEWTKASLNTS